MEDQEPIRRFTPRPPRDGELLPVPAQPMPISREMAALDQEANRLMDEALAPATREAYEADWRRFRLWCDEQGAQPLPASVQTIVRYLTWLGSTCEGGRRREKGLQASYVNRVRAAISTIHEDAGIPSPCYTRPVQKVMTGLMREQVGSDRRAKPIMPEHLCAMVAWAAQRWSDTPLRAQRARAILLTGFAGALRESELVALNRSNVTVTSGKELRLFLPTRKTDQFGAGTRITFERRSSFAERGICPLHAMQAWLDRSGGAFNPTGADKPVFWRMSRGGCTTDRMGMDAVDRLIKAGIAGIGLNPLDYSSHSLRAGFTTFAVDRLKMREIDVMRHTGHSSVFMLKRYVREPDRLPSRWAGVKLSPNT